MASKYVLAKMLPLSIRGQVMNPLAYIVGQTVIGEPIVNERTSPPTPGVILVVKNYPDGKPREIFVPGTYFSPNVNIWDCPPMTSSVQVNKDVSMSGASTVTPSSTPESETIFSTDFGGDMVQGSSSGKPGYPVPEDITKVVKESIKTIGQITNTSNPTQQGDDNSNLFGFGLIGLFLWRLFR